MITQCGKGHCTQVQKAKEKYTIV